MCQSKDCMQMILLVNACLNRVTRCCPEVYFVGEERIWYFIYNVWIADVDQWDSEAKTCRLPVWVAGTCSSYYTMSTLLKSHLIYRTQHFYLDRCQCAILTWYERIITEHTFQRWTKYDPPNCIENDIENRVCLQFHSAESPHMFTYKPFGVFTR